MKWKLKFNFGSSFKQSQQLMNSEEEGGSLWIGPCIDFTERIENPRLKGEATRGDARRCRAERRPSGAALLFAAPIKGNDPSQPVGAHPPFINIFFHSLQTFYSSVLIVVAVVAVVVRYHRFVRTTHGDFSRLAGNLRDSCYLPSCDALASLSGIWMLQLLLWRHSGFFLFFRTLWCIPWNELELDSEEDSAPRIHVSVLLSSLWDSGLFENFLS